MSDLCPTCKRPIPKTAELFGLKVRRELNKRGLKLKDLGLLLGKDETYISRLVNGRHNPSLGVMKQVADGLGMTLSQLLENVQ